MEKQILLLDRSEEQHFLCVCVCVRYMAFINIFWSISEMFPF